MGKRTDGQMGRPADRQTGRQADGGMCGWEDGQTGGRPDGRTGAQTHVARAGRLTGGLTGGQLGTARQAAVAVDVNFASPPRTAPLIDFPPAGNKLCVPF